VPIVINDPDDASRLKAYLTTSSSDRASQAAAAPNHMLKRFTRRTQMGSLAPLWKVHLIGIGGTGMGAVAGLSAEAGHEVRCSDAASNPR